MHNPVHVKAVVHSGSVVKDVKAVAVTEPVQYPEDDHVLWDVKVPAMQ